MAEISYHKKTVEQREKIWKNNCNGLWQGSYQRRCCKIAIQSAVELAKNPDNKVIYFAANAEVDECLQSNEAIKVVCIDTPHIASNKIKLKQVCMEFGMDRQNRIRKIVIGFRSKAYGYSYPWVEQSFISICCCCCSEYAFSGSHYITWLLCGMSKWRLF